MAADNYRHSEDEYFKLRGQFDTGRITQEQFDEKLRDLMVQDAQGRYWMLGADTGKWYYYDGAKWVPGDPYGAVSAAAATAAAAVVPPTPAPARTASQPASATTSSARRGLPLIPILLIVLAVGVAIAAFLLFQNRDQIFVARQPEQITPILPPTITRAPSPTPLNAQSTAAAVGTAVQAPIASPVPVTDVPTDEPPIAEPTEIPPTPEPAITIVVITPMPTVTLIVPTLLPTVTPVPTQVPTAVPTNPPPTVPPPPTNTPLPNVPPDVYVTGLTISPNPAKKNQQATFSANFLNTTGGPRSYNLLILTYDPNKPGPNKQFGESPAVGMTVPPGASVQTLMHIPATGPGGCVPLYARVAWRAGQFDKPLLPNTSGDPATVFFDVCPP